MEKYKLINIQNLNISIFRKRGDNYLYVYNTSYYTIIRVDQSIKIINNTFIYIDRRKPTAEGELGLFFKQFYICEYVKIKFSGKGYKIKKNNQQSLVLLFNRSHMTVM